MIAWLREHELWVFERPSLELLADRALVDLVEEVLDSMCAPGTEADPSVIAYEDRPGHLRYSLRSSASEAEKLASRRLAVKRREEAQAVSRRAEMRQNGLQTRHRERPKR